MSFVGSNILAGASGQGGAGYEIERSLRFNPSDSAKLTRTFSAGNRKTFTISLWAKKSRIGGTYEDLFTTSTGGQFRFIWEPNGNLEVYSHNGSITTFHIDTVALFRDPSAWYHFVVSVDATNTSVKFYVNGVELTDFVVHTAVQNADTMVNSATLHTIGHNSSGQYFDGYLADVHFIDGQALAATDFGETDDNGVWQAIKYAGTYGTNGFHLDFADNSSNAALGTDSSNNSNTWTVNNLVATAGLATANQGFDVVTYTGNGGTQSISSLAFQPDFVWLKSRNNNYDHEIYDSVRGATKRIYANVTDAEATFSNGLTSFDSSGFSVGDRTNVNGSSSNMVAWCWKAGGAASSNSDGSITSSVSANASHGFSIIKAPITSSGGTIGTGLNASPGMLIVKNIGTNGTNWVVWHSSLGTNDYLLLNSGAAKATSSNLFNGVSNSTFTVGSGFASSTPDFICYAWSEVAGFSKFGSYTGNGSATGPVVTTGFKPRWIMVKGSSHASNWNIVDTARSSSNPQSNILRANSGAAEFSTPTGQFGIAFDALDDGFQLKSGSSTNDVNQTGETYIYAAFAAKPDGSVIDSLVDTPTNVAEPTDTGVGNEVVGNYPTFNPLSQQYSSAVHVLRNGNLQVGDGTTSKGNYALEIATMAAPPSGKWYWEMTFDGANSNERRVVAVMNSDANFAQYIPHDNSADGFVGIWCETGQKIINGSRTSYASAIGDGDVVGVALDQNANTVNFYVNGTDKGSISLPSNMVGKSVLPAVSSIQAEENIIANFGQRAFAYAAPSGYKSLNTANLPDPTIADGSKYFDTKLYTGNGGTNAQTGLGFSPDLLWLKVRSQAFNHNLFDSVRGNTKHLSSNLTNAEYTESSGRGLTAFDSNGFTLGQDVQGPGSVNASGQTYAGWAWDAGSSNTTIAAGGLNSSVYNTDDVWSDDVTSTLRSGTHANNSFANTFNGQIGDSQNIQWTQINANDPWTFAPSGGIASVTSLKAYVYPRLGTLTFNVNGTQVTTNTGNSLNTVDLSSAFSGGAASLTNLTITSANSGLYWGIIAVEVNGKLLVNTSASPPNVPTIASTVRANPSAGFSIVKWTGNYSAATVGHGLNDAVKFYIVKNLDQSNDWLCWHTGLSGGGQGYIRLNTTGAAATASSPWNSTVPTNSVFSLGVDGNTNGNGDEMIAYCFAPVEGYSQISSFVGTQNADGPFIHTGFRPRWLLLRNATNTTGVDWVILDTARDTYNIADARLNANTSSAETTESFIDILSNGFKVRTGGQLLNGSGQTIIYLAFASNPFKTARAR